MDANMIRADSFRDLQNGVTLSGPDVIIELPAVPRLFYRHGWHSWSLAAWIDPTLPNVPISSTLLSAKDEDPVYAHSPLHTGAWVGAVELPDGSIILLGALDLGGRVQPEGASLRGFYETGSGEWFMVQGSEEQVFAAYSAQLEKHFCKAYPYNAEDTEIARIRRHARIPRVWCSWYSLYSWVSESSFREVLDGLGDLPFDVIQVDVAGAFYGFTEFNPCTPASRLAAA
jgi:alpha-galactosidase